MTEHVIKYVVGDTVELKKYNAVGVIKFIGEIPSKQGIFYGIELDEDKGKNDGSVSNTYYFKTAQNKGIFVRENSISMTNKQKRNPKYNENLPRITVWDKVKVQKSKSNIKYDGTVRYIGTPSNKKGIWYGVELKTPNGKNNGTVNGHCYFQCAPKYGLFVTASAIFMEYELFDISNVVPYKRRRSHRQCSDTLISATFFPLLNEPFAAIATGTNTVVESDNEFPCDASSHCGYSSHSTSIDDIMFDNRNDDVLYKLDSICEYTLEEMLNNEEILHDSLIKVFSTHMEQYIDVCGVLTKENLYLISATKYQIWMEFRDRTKVNYLMDENTKIEHEMASQLVKNLDLTNDHNTNAKIMIYLTGKTAKEIKLNILLNTNNIKSVASLFELKHHKNNSSIGSNEEFGGPLELLNKGKALEIQDADLTDLRDTKYIIISEFYNDNVIPQHLRSDLLQFMFEDIQWIDENKKNNSIIITLKKYCNSSVVQSLNQRKQKYLEDRSLFMNEKRLKVSRCLNNTIFSQNELKVVDLKQFNDIKLVKLQDIGYGFCLKTQNKPVQKERLTFRVDSNNARFEWITYLDYALNGDLKMEAVAAEEKKNDIKIINDKLMNDFTNKKSNPLCADNEEYSTNFNFGKYLNYWHRGYKNSVKPNYATLKHELLNNTISKISLTDYYHLVKSCIKLMRLKGRQITAQDIGINNKKFNIHKGAPITINHLISLKLYTDFGNTQKEFKKHCRKFNESESTKHFVKRNSEIAHWSRYLKESCTFYGTLMSMNGVLYTGLKVKLMFDSMEQHFECPLSTTLCCNIAQGFCDDNGIILKLKAANSKTRYFDLSWLSHYPQEKERLIMGSSLKIIDIFIRAKTSRNYISALTMFEQIIDGQFIDNKKDKIEAILYDLIMLFTNKNHKIDGEVPPKYIIALFQNLVKKMEKQKKSKNFWINKHEIENIKNQQLKHAFNESKEFNVNSSNTKFVQQFQWTLKNSAYTKFKNMKPGKSISSKQFNYIINGNDKIKFHLECRSKYSYDDAPKCALFLHLNELPSHVQRIRVEYHVICDKKRKYKNIMPAQWLSENKKYCGFQTFPSEKLNNNTSVSWKIGLKVVDLQYYNCDNHNLVQYRENFNIDDVLNAVDNFDKSSILQMVKVLFSNNAKLRLQVSKNCKSPINK